MKFAFRICAAIALPAALLTGAVFPRLSLEELVERSQSIVEGTVTRSWAGWDSKHQFVWTHYEVLAVDWLRGPGTRTLVISEPGGTVDGVTQMTSGTIPYSSGEHVMLFLYPTPIGYVRATGGPQGKLDVDAAGRVRLSLAGSEFVGVPASSATPIPSLGGLSVGAVKSRVRGMLSAHPYRGESQ